MMDFNFCIGITRHGQTVHCLVSRSSCPTDTLTTLYISNSTLRTSKVASAVSLGKSVPLASHAMELTATV